MAEENASEGGQPRRRPALYQHPHHDADELQAFERHIVARVREKRATRAETVPNDEQLTFGQKVADAVADTMGSWPFIIGQSIVLAAWIAANVIGFVNQWDPYPFILLNLMLSFQAAYSAPFIMMSQNRQETRDRMRAELDLQTDLKAETLIEELHGSIEDLRIKRWAELLEVQQQQIEMLRELVLRVTVDLKAESPAPESPSAT